MGAVVELALALAGEDPGQQLQGRVVVAGQWYEPKVGATGQASLDRGLGGGVGADQRSVDEPGAQQR